MRLLASLLLVLLAVASAQTTIKVDIGYPDVEQGIKDAAAIHYEFALTQAHHAPNTVISPAEYQTQLIAQLYKSSACGEVTAWFSTNAADATVPAVGTLPAPVVISQAASMQNRFYCYTIPATMWSTANTTSVFLHVRATGFGGCRNTVDVVLGSSFVVGTTNPQPVFAESHPTCWNPTTVSAHPIALPAAKSGWSAFFNLAYQKSYVATTGAYMFAQGSFTRPEIFIANNGATGSPLYVLLGSATDSEAKFGVCIHRRRLNGTSPSAFNRANCDVYCEPINKVTNECDPDAARAVGTGYRTGALPTTTERDYFLTLYVSKAGNNNADARVAAALGHEPDSAFGIRPSFAIMAVLAFAAAIFNRF